MKKEFMKKKVTKKENSEKTDRWRDLTAKRQKETREERHIWAVDTR
ncbi:hypothetical protein KGMB01110_27210 [Mediterraneibacter butyricigenes]|uniref:Uncharacterized protein n=1 Tax=Mediterraneibacter butyricigenes TaxID=2316025 RepID=A0A391P3U4_9FIRM|nr:hypothetical protein KGMB01110_27210 [Mediterraneibacter butyricigenes]